MRGKVKGIMQSSIYMENYKIWKKIKNDSKKASVIEALGEEKFDKIMIDNFKTKNNMPNAKVRKEASNLSFYLHSTYDPVEEARMQTKVLSFKKHTLIIVFGFGMGYHIKEILKKMSSKSKLVVIEPFKDIFYNAMYNVDITDILNDSRVYLFLGLLPRNLITIWNSMGKAFFDLSNNLQYIYLSYYINLLNDISFYLKEILDITKLSWEVLGNCPFDHNIGLIQSIINAKDILDAVGIRDVGDIFRDTRAIIVAAGPSLDKNIHYLREAKGKAIIIAVDAVLRKLVKKDIMPDIIVTVERITVYDNILKEIDIRAPKELIFAAPFVTEPLTVKYFNENLKLFWSQKGAGTLKYLDGFYEKGEMVNATSAVFSAINLARILGADKIALVGLDLAYGEDGRTYCDGISKVGIENEMNRKKDETYIVKVKDYKGNEIYSNVLWKNQLITISLFASTFPNIKLYDATEGGAYIEGSEIIELKNFIYKFCTSPIEDIYSKIKSKLPNLKENKKIEILSSLLDDMKKQLEMFDEIREKIINHMDIMEEWHSKFSEDLNSHNKNLGRIEKIINNTQKIIDEILESDILTLYFQGTIANFKKDINAIEDEIYTERVRKNLYIQFKYLKQMEGLLEFHTACFKKASQILQLIIEDKFKYTDTREIFKIIMSELGMSSDIIDRYYETILNS